MTKQELRLFEAMTELAQRAENCDICCVDEPERNDLKEAWELLKRKYGVA